MKKLSILMASAAMAALSMNASVGQNIYIMGSGTGLSWENFPGKVVTPSSDGSYTVTIENLTSFKMSTANASGWDDFNSSAFGFSGSYGDAVFTTNGQTVKLEPWGEDQLLPATGSYTLKINSDRSSMTIKANFSKPTTAPAVYIRGLNGDWNASSSNQMTYDSATGSYYFNGTINANTGFKFADASWGNINYGIPKGTGAIDPSGQYTLAFNNDSDDIKLKTSYTGKVTFKITGEKQAYVVFGDNGGGGDNPNPPTPPTGDDTVTWVNIGGPFNGYNYFDDGQQPDAEGIATFTDQAIGTSGFKIKTWNESIDVYYISENGTIATDQWVQLYEDIYDAPESVIDGAAAGNVYTVKFNVKTNQVYVTLTSGNGGGDDPNPPTPPTPPTGDDTVTWVNIGGPFNGYNYFDDGQQPDAEGIATFTDQAIGTSGFKIKTWNESIDVYYISDPGTIATDQWVQLYEDIYDAPEIVIDGAEAGNVYTVKFNVKTNQVYVTLTSGNGGGDDPNPPTPPTPPTGDDTVTWVNIGGPFNGYNYFDDGQQPDAEGIATFTDQAIGTSGFKIKTWNESIDVYYIADTGTIATDQWVQLYEDIYDAPESVIDGAEAGNVYTVKFNVKTNQVYVTLSSGNGGGGDDPNPPTPPTPGTDKDLYLVGSYYGNWTLDTQYKFTQNGNVYTITLPDGLFAGDYGWKIWDGSWDYNFGCGENQPEFGVEYETWFDGGNFTISADSKTTITLTVVEGSDVKNSDIPSKLRIDAVTGAIDNIAIDDTDAVYFNLQGARVVNPDKGIYIRVSNGKAEKVIK